MDRPIALAFLLLAFLGLFFLGKGITGYVVSESCCIPPGCDPENICNSANPDNPVNIDEPAPNTVFGILLLILAIGSYGFFRVK